MKYSQKYTLVTFIKPLQVGAEFRMHNWPLHVTLADVFAINLNTDIIQKLVDLLAKQSPIHLSVGEDTTLGATKVALINNTNELQNLHDKLINLLEFNGAQFNIPEFTRKGFLPHSTIQRSVRLKTNDKFKLVSASLIDMFPQGDWQQRKVLHNFSLRKF